MLAKDKLILVFYIDTSNIDVDDHYAYLDEIVKALKVDDDSLMQYFVPTEEYSRIECLNPKLMPDNDYKEIQEKIDIFQKAMDEWLEEHKPNKENK